MQEDVVNHPSHYVKNAIRLEPIDILENFDFCTGNALKYILRYKDKNKPVEDLEKAMFYARRVLVRNLLKKKYLKDFYFLSKSSNCILHPLGNEDFNVQERWKRMLYILEKTWKEKAMTDGIKEKDGIGKIG